jgi:hypothetical protein
MHKDFSDMISLAMLLKLESKEYFDYKHGQACMHHIAWTFTGVKGVRHFNPKWLHEHSIKYGPYTNLELTDSG